MSKKDYELIASVIRELNMDEFGRVVMAEVFAIRLHAACPGFNMATFRKACLKGQDKQTIKLMQKAYSDE